MFATQEVRWFRTTPMPELLDWFESHGPSWNQTKSRIDHYQVLSRDDLGIKLREGSVESKIRVTRPLPFTLQEGYTGFMDEWEKFSFRIAAHDKESHFVLNDRYPDRWIPIRKRRMGLKAVHVQEGWSLLPMSEFPGNGIQLEYTEIEKGGITFFSFCLESFGDNRPALETWDLPLPSGVNLKSEESYSYPKFLLR